MVHAGIEAYRAEEPFDYIFIPSGSVSLFTGPALCRAVLANLRECLAEGGNFLFSVDTLANRFPDREAYCTERAVDAAGGGDAPSLPYVCSR